VRTPPPPRARGSPKTGGRQKGTRNHATLEIKAFAHSVLNDPGYRKNVLVRMRALEPPAHLETLLYHYAFGKPPQALELSGTFDHAVYLASKTPLAR
jgi:hypothetical protein